MLQFSKPSQYALRALICVADHGPCTKDFIAEQAHLPKHFLAKILKDLQNQDMIKYVRGKSGGYSLKKSPEAIDLFDVINMFERVDDELGVCAMGIPGCGEGQPCTLHHCYAPVREAIRSFLKGHHLDNFCSGASKAP
jgi:Rrf2 family iron-sulfur cluster assembly transcriptional regulator